MTRKLLSLVLALAMLVSCTSFAFADDMIELTMFNSETSNYQDYDVFPLNQMLTEQTGVQMHFDVPVGDGTEKLNIMLTGDTYPEILYHSSYAIMNLMIKDEYILPLEDLIEQYAPNIKTLYGTLWEDLFWDDGHIWSLPSSFGESAYKEGDVTSSWAGWTFNVRGDIYTALGSPEVKDLDDVYELLCLIRDKYPTNAAGESFYPLGGFVQTWQNMLETLIQSAGGYGGRYYIGEDNQLAYWTRAPWAEPIIKWYNKVYREGLMDPEAFTMDRNTFNQEKIGGDRVCSYFGIHYYVDAQLPSLAARGIEDPYFENFPVSVPEVGQRPNVVSEALSGGKFLVLTDKLKNDEAKLQAALKWLNAFADEKNNFIAVNGYEGEYWKIDETGKTVLLRNDWSSSNALNFMLKVYGTTSWGASCFLSRDPIAMGDPRAYTRQLRVTPYIYDSSFYQNMNNNMNDEQNLMRNNIENAFHNYIYEAILADSEEKCLELYAKYIAGIEAMGLAELENYWNAEYQAYHAE